MTDQCWYWSGSYFANGYGQTWSSALARPLQAHRMVYQELVGMIPAGLQIDHLCRVRGCVNPKHLRVVTCRENIMAHGARTLAKANVAKGECKRGHAFNEENTYEYNGHRHCRPCRKEEKRQRRARHSDIRT